MERISNKYLRYTLFAAFLLVGNIFLCHASDICTMDSLVNDTAKVDSDYIPSIDSPVYAADESGNIVGPTFTMLRLSEMGVEKAMETIREMKSAYNISDLFKMNQGTKAFYLNNELMDALISELENAGRAFNKDDDKGICKYTEILRAGFYRAFFSSALDTIASWEYKEKLLPALESIIDNPAFSWGDFGNSVQDKVIYSVGALMGSGITSVGVIEKISSLVRRFNDNRTVYANDSSKISAMLRLGDGIDYALCTDRYKDYRHPDKSQFYGHIDTYVEELSKLALYKNNLTDKNSKLFVHAVRWVGDHTGRMLGDKQQLAFLKNTLDTYPYCSRPWIEAIKNMDYYFEDELKVMDMKQVRKDVEAALLPNWYYFEDSTLVFNTGDKVDPKKVQLLYWATKEVKDQFLRLVMRDTPIDGFGRKDDQLVASIFNSPEEYQYNWFLNEVDTDNGGIYIESWGKFFTWERTPSESIYTLEELFRHEFTHYLQGRYLCPGEWGEGPLYEGSGLTWVEEGGAEFQAGSTRADGVPTRKVMLKRLPSERTERISLDSLLNSGYELGSQIYTYSYVMYRFMYEQHPEIMQELFKTIQTGNAENYKALVKRLREDKVLEQEFVDFMDELKKKEEEFTDRTISEDYADNISAKNHKELYREIQKLAKLKNMKVIEHRSYAFNTFELRGEFVLGKTKGEVQDRMLMDEMTDELLKALSLKEWNGYKTVTAYFLNYKIEKGKSTFELVFKGYLPSEQ